MKCAAPDVPFIEARHAPIDLINGDGQSYPLDELAGKDVAVFCGIGNPEGFRRTLIPLCRRLIELKVFPDHHLYTAGDVMSLGDWAGKMQADLALTTQKDSVKLRTATLGRVPLPLRIGLEIMDGLNALERLLEPLLPVRETVPQSTE